MSTPESRGFLADFEPDAVTLPVDRGIPCSECGELAAVVLDSHPCGGEYVVHVEGVCAVTGSYHSLDATKAGPEGPADAEGEAEG